MAKPKQAHKKKGIVVICLEFCASSKNVLYVSSYVNRLETSNNLWPPISEPKEKAKVAPTKKGEIKYKLKDNIWVKRCFTQCLSLL